MSGKSLGHKNHISGKSLGLTKSMSGKSLGLTKPMSGKSLGHETVTVTFLYYEAVSKLMFDVHNQSAPINILKLFTKTSHIHTYNTRSSKSQLFSTKHSRLNLQKKAFSRVGVKVWNKIPKEFKTLSKDSFNKQMKKSLFQILDNEDSYLDIENTSSKLKECIIKSN